MKKISIIVTIALLLGLFSCQNEKWEFPDYDYSTVYFPYQTPVRTLVLGDYLYDNENDNNLKFLISAHLGGMYKNSENQSVDFVIDQNLVNNLATDAGDTLKILPSSYYSISSNQIVIPKGQFYAGCEVQLTDAFLNDPKSYKTHYVLPLRITETSLDSILSGMRNVANPDYRIAGNWSVLPKNYTIFGIKFINPYHGKYLYRGQSIIKDAGNNVIETIIYRQKNIERDEIISLKTSGRNKVTIKSVVRATAGSPGELLMDLDFNESTGVCTVTNNPASLFPISGTGKFVKNGDMWGNKERDAIYLNYQILVGTNQHTINDTLVIRDRDVRFESFKPVLY